MKKSIIYILFALFSFSAAVSLTACKDDGVEISDAYKSKTPKNVKLLEYGNKSLTICWDFVRGATSYTVQLVDGDMNPVSEALCMTTADIDYHEFTDLPTDRIYYGRVRANYPYSATSDWVYVTEHDKPAMLMASVGILDLDPQLKLHAASGSTLTFEWSYTDDKATDAARSYNVELFRDEPQPFMPSASTYSADVPPVWMWNSVAQLQRGRSPSACGFTPSAFSHVLRKSVPETAL